MVYEDERRFLDIQGRFWDDIDVQQPVNILQGYFEVPDPSRSFRVRIMNQSVASQAIKIGEGLRRREVEENISLPMGLELMETCHHRIQKDRYRIARTASRDWEIDVFKGSLKGITLIECELDDPDEVITLPPWAADAIEVTQSLTNLHLARLASDLVGTNENPLPVLREHLASKLKRIVVTGPPGSGKSTLLKEIGERYPGIHVVPEVASIIIGQLRVTPHKSGHSMNRFQRTIYRTQNIFEMTSVEFAASRGKQGCVFDRGTLDAAAYFEKGTSQFERLFRTTMAREYAKYDACLLLAMPPEDIYEQIRANNPARSEGYAQVRHLSRKMWHIWKEHPRFIPIGGNSWDAKRQTAFEAIDDILAS